jgi:hypothetical protein
MWLIADNLPKPQVQASRFPVHISYFLQKCKKGKSGEMDLPLQKNDITTSEPAFGIADT